MLDLFYDILASDGKLGKFALQLKRLCRTHRFPQPHCAEYDY